MSDEQQGPSGPREPDVGSVGEEAAKLFGVLSGWAHEHVGDQPGPDQAATAGEAVHGIADALGDIVGNVNEHIATRGPDCLLCPVCQVIHAVRETNPEVKQQLSVAASSLLHAVAGLLSTQVPQPEGAGVEKIDLSGDTPWDDEQ